MKNGITEKIVLGFLRSVSILFLIFEKGDKRKNCAKVFEDLYIYFFNIWKMGISEKIVLGFLRFASILFSLIIFSIKRSYRDFGGFYVCFLMWLFFSENGGHIDMWCFYVFFFNVIIFLVWIGVIQIFGGMDKNF